MKADRPQKFSNISPYIYGFFPKTYCGPEVANCFMKASGRVGVNGDGDPLDVCVLSEKNLTQSGIIMRVRPIGGIRLLDKGEVDDKIIAVFYKDPIYGYYNDVKDLPHKLIDRLRHYFLTYKNIPEEGVINKVEILEIYGRDEAIKIIDAAAQDYTNWIG